MLGVCCSCQTPAETTIINGQRVMAAHPFANGKHGISLPCEGEETVPQALIRDQRADCQDIE